MIKVPSHERLAGHRPGRGMGETRPVVGGSAS
jgi:hypothetical protein